MVTPFRRTFTRYLPFRFSIVAIGIGLGQIRDKLLYVIKDHNQL
nr:MAG TPA: hypothetical protein [Caudoviricetes sp.]